MLRIKLAFILVMILFNSNIKDLFAMIPEDSNISAGDNMSAKCSVADTPIKEKMKKTAEEIDAVKTIEEDVDSEIEENTEDNLAVEENEIQKEEVEEAEEGKDCIYNVSFPTASTAHLDPGNLSGKGQIFSDEYKIENYGNTDIAIKIKNIDVHFESKEEVYELIEEKVTEDHAGIKKLNVNVVWRNEKDNTEEILNVVEGSSDEYVITLKASEYNENGEFLNLCEGSTGFFYFTGSVTDNPWTVWDDDRIVMRFDYEITSVGNEESQDSEEGQQEKEIDQEDVLQQEEAMSLKEDIYQEKLEESQKDQAIEDDFEKEKMENKIKSEEAQEESNEMDEETNIKSDVQ